MKRHSKIFLAAPFLFLFGNLSPTALAHGQDDMSAEEEERKGPTPEEVLAAAPTEHWLPIPVTDLMIFTLPDAADGTKREIVMQLLPANLSGGHVRNVRKMAQARWWDGTKIYRVAKDFVTQFGGNPDNKAVPKSLETVPEREYFNAALGSKRDADSKALKAAVDYSNQYQGTEVRPLMKITVTSAISSRLCLPTSRVRAKLLLSTMPAVWMVGRAILSYRRKRAKPPLRASPRI